MQATLRENYRFLVVYILAMVLKSIEVDFKIHIKYKIFGYYENFIMKDTFKINWKLFTMCENFEEAKRSSKII